MQGHQLVNIEFEKLKKKSKDIVIIKKIKDFYIYYIYLASVLIFIFPFGSYDGASASKY